MDLLTSCVWPLRVLCLLVVVMLYAAARRAFWVLTLGQLRVLRCVVVVVVGGCLVAASWDCLHLVRDR
jgi:hypothetical protein